MSRGKSVERLSERAEFYLCLARTFLPPIEERERVALREYLADDLFELSTEIGYPLRQAIAALREQLREIKDDEIYLGLYSRLFLVPPVPAHLNASLYLDGTIMGPSVAEIEKAHRHFGLAPSPQFHNTPDHLASLLEFIAYLFAIAEQKNAQEGNHQTQELLRQVAYFLQHYLVSWLPKLHNDLKQASVKGEYNPYIVLVDLLFVAASRDLTWLRPNEKNDKLPATRGASSDSGKVHLNL